MDKNKKSSDHQPLLINISININKINNIQNKNINNNLNSEKQNFIEYPKESLIITDNEENVKLAMNELIKNIKNDNYFINLLNYKINTGSQFALSQHNQIAWHQ